VLIQAGYGDSSMGYDSGMHPVSVSTTRIHSSLLLSKQVVIHSFVAYSVLAFFVARQGGTHSCAMHNEVRPFIIQAQTVNHHAAVRSGRGFLFTLLCN
jgi:hypothetical protein